MATETDAARDRVLEARAALGEELETLEASVRAAADIPAKIRRNPARAAAVAGGAGFLAIGGPRRVLRAGRRAVFGAPAPFPKSMLPEEIDKSLRRLGDDGDKVRGRSRARLRGLFEEGQWRPGPRPDPAPADGRAAAPVGRHQGRHELALQAPMTKASRSALPRSEPGPPSE